MSSPVQRKRQRGTTLVEVAIALPIILVGLALLTQSLVQEGRLRRSQSETMAAADGAQAALERVRNEPFRDVLRIFNDDPFDDPLGPGTALGARFDVPGLQPVEGA